ncbi:uncharacterized protein LOC135714779 [Ochlerotatus camptorhynchus]|uniref:uncharacterized protein LOC135714779 n=1 Tax=Ochlerotatus camptorhynchus TaxID=644619 RepID=UPI0031D5B2E1
MSTDRRLKTLKLRMKSLQTSFMLTKTFVDKYVDEQHSLEVPVRLESLTKLWTDFCAVQSELETIDEAGIEQLLKDRASYESSYYKVKGFLLSVNKLTPPSPTPTASTSHSNFQGPTSSHVRLPDIKLPVFSGNLDYWMNFHDLYMSLVHSSAELSNIQKFYYLRSSLSGDALKLVQTIPITAANYSVAWNLLEEHFQNKPRLKQSYLNALFEFSTLKRESAADLHALVERFESNVKVLQQLGEKTEFWDLILIRMLSVRLDATTRRDWEEFSSAKDDVSFKDLTSFIQRRVSVLQTLHGKGVETPPSSSSYSQPKKFTQRPAACHTISHVSTDRKCSICSEHHPLYMCPTFSNLAIEDKEKEIRRLQLCRNCLRKGHLVRECPSSSSCRKCRNRHHTQLCHEETSTGENHHPTTSKTTTTHTTEEQPRTSASVTVTELPNYAATECKQTTVLLATAVVLFVDDNGREHAVRALLDSGSECCFVSERFLQTVTVQRKRVSVPISGIVESTVNAKFTVPSHIRSRVCNYSTTVECLVLPRLTMDLPSTSVDASTWSIPPGIQLADPSFHSRKSIDLVLGAEVFYDIFHVSGRIRIGDALPPLINSTLGWVVSGKASSPQPKRPLVVNVASIADLSQIMERFWTIEEDTSSPSYSVEEAACEAHFQQTVSRNQQGRYIVRLPVKPDVLTSLGDNRRTAVRRFRMIQQRMGTDPQLRIQYVDFMNEYHALGHMQKVDDYETPPKPCYHLPHHAVVREESTTTKVRVVFDASCKTSQGRSLNDALMVGPIVQEEMRSIIMRSRTRRIMLVADAKQMFRQILVDERDTPLLRIVWQISPDLPLDTYELKTVTYGTACAPFLATRVLQQLADDEQDNFPRAAEVLRKDFYVDDLFSGADSEEEAIELREQLDTLLSKGGFTLRKWASNIPAVLHDVSSDNRALQPSVDFDRDQCIKTLGLHWEPSTDCLRYRICLSPDPVEATITKRTVLSKIARLFDPIGLVGPVVTSAKLFMQELWTLKTNNGEAWGWDEELPAAIKERWLAYCEQLPRLNDLRIERWVICSTPTSIQLHFFSDASKNAYGACCYIRSANSSGTIKVALLTARSRVAPLKQQSIPRLELCGALLATELFQKVRASLNHTGEVYFWVDSTIVLSWLKAPPTTWVTFVANRVSKIQQATQHCAWNHVVGQLNPADCISRGTEAETILHNDLWWRGPPWLHLEPSSWPNQLMSNITNEIALPEARKLPLAATAITTEPSFVDVLVSKFSNYFRLLRIVAYCRRFIRNCKPSAQTTHPFLSSEELGEAETTVIRLVQQQSYNEEWKTLQKLQPVSLKSKLRWFQPFIASDQLMRIGGRLNQAPQPFDSKHQIILPAKHGLSTLLLRSLHEKHLHAAPQLLVNILRLRYWITMVRNLAKTIVHNCVTCVRARPKLLQQFMSELPASRVTASRPFSITGIDYWGPISLQPPHRRAAPRKAYVAVFVCFSTRVVHLELVADLTTAKFLQALRRFVARRGLCNEIYSDNGRNFIGAANELRKMIQSKEHHRAIADECASHGIRWRFNPPKASHFGGLWEAAFQSAQKHFVRVLGTSTLAHDDMETLLSQIECCLNSRPIIPLSDDPTDYDVLTPGHFLIGSALKSVPDVDVSEIPSNRLAKWQQIQKNLQIIWKRWHLEYLATLQPRTKWCNPPIVLEKGQLVLLMDEKTPPMAWPTARIVELHPGADGNTRVVTLRTAHGTYTRPVSKICLLPIPSSNEKSSKQTIRPEAESKHQQ